MLEKLIEVLSEQLSIDPDRITEDSEIKADLGADSLDVLELLMAFEEEYGIRIPDEALAGFVTVGDVLDYLEKNV